MLDKVSGGPLDLCDWAIFGNPYHGLMQAGQLIADAATKTAATGAAPAEWPHVNKSVYAGTHGGTWVFSNKADAGRGPEQQAADALIGHRWDNYTLLGGPTRAIYGTANECGEQGWLWADDDGVVWLVKPLIDAISDTGITLRLRLRRFGAFGLTEDLKDHAPQSLNWSQSLNLYPRYPGLTFQDATHDGGKAAFLVVGYPTSEVGWETPGTVLTISLSGLGAAPIATLAEWGNKTLHNRTTGTPPERLTSVPNAVHTTLSHGQCDPGATLVPAPYAQPDNYIETPYQVREHTLFVYYDDQHNLHRVSAFCDEYSASGSSRVDGTYNITSVDISPNSSSAGCGDGSILKFKNGSFTSYDGHLHYSNLGILLDGVDTDCMIKYREEGLTVQSHTDNDFQAAQDATGCTVPSDPCDAGWAAYTLYWFTITPPWYGSPHPDDNIVTVTGDLGGLLADLGIGDGIVPAGWGEHTMRKLFRPSSVTGQTDYGWAMLQPVDNTPMVRLECLDRHVWAFTRTHGRTGTAYAIGTEAIKMIHTPVHPDGHALDLAATRTQYGANRYRMAPIIAYHRVTGDVATHGSENVCYL